MLQAIHPVRDISAEDPYNTIAAHSTRATLELHYGLRHAGYVKKPNQLIQDTPFEPSSREQIVDLANARAHIGRDNHGKTRGQ